MSGLITVSRSFMGDSDSIGAQFFDDVKNGSASEGDYPYIYTVAVGGNVFIGFDSGLPTSREPWYCGYKAFDRNTVLEADTLEEVPEDAAADVNALIDVAGADVGTQTASVLFTNEQTEPDADSSDDLGELFG